MRLARILGATGRALISAGVIVLLFVGYQLWGTSLQEAAAQGNLESELTERFESDAVLEAQEVLAAAVDEANAAAAEAAATADETDPDADSGEAPEVAELVEPDFSDLPAEFISALYPEDGESLARIVIEDIGVDKIVVEGVSVEDLREGPGHYGSTPNPGQAGNAAIAGHRTTYGAPFHRIDELEPGASIFVTTVQGTFEYRVKEDSRSGESKGHFIVSPTDTWVLGQDTGENLLTLTACHPKYSARQRIIVQAELVGEPAATIPRDEAEGLAPVEISAGETDEANQSASGGEDVETVMSDEVAADDDPSVDAEGNPISDEAPAGDTGDTGDTEVADDSVAEPAEETSGDEAASSADAGAGDDVELTSAQTPFGEATDFGEGLNGDRTRIRPAIMWGLAAGAIWLAAWFLGHRMNRKWTLYAIGLIPFGFVLWASFVNIDQALPSY